MATTATDAVGAVVTAVLIGRLLGEQATGEYAYAQTLASVALAITGLGLPSYAVQRAARARALGEPWQSLVGPVLGLYLFLSLPAALLGFACLSSILGSRLGRASVVLPAVWSVFSLGFSGLVLASLQGLGRFTPGLLASAATRVGSVLAVLVVHHFDLSIGGFFFALAGIQTIVAVSLVRHLALWAQVDVLTRPSHEWIQHTVRAIPFGVTTLLEIVYSRADTLLVAWLLGPKETGWYVAAYTLFTAPNLLSYAVAIAFYPEAARAAAGSSRATNYRRILSRLLVYGVLCALALAITAADLVSALYGERFARSVPVLKILCWAVPLVAASRLVVIRLKGRNQAGRAALASLTATCVAITGNLLFLRQFGLDAAAWVTVATEGVLLAVALTPTRWSGWRG